MPTEIKRIHLIAAAKELNELLDAEPKIRTVAMKSEDMIPHIKKAGELLEKGDKITTATKEVLEGLEVELPEGIIIDDNGGPADDLDSDEVAEPVDLTVESLTALIAEMNDVMSLDPVIEVTGEETIDGLKAIIKENCYDKGECQVFDTDKFNAESWATLKALGVNAVSGTPEPAEKKDKGKSGKKDAPPATTKGKGEKSAGKGTPAKGGKPATATKKDKPAPAPKGPGVIKSIASIIKEKGPITKENILAELVKLFPERTAEAMKNTINVQIPNRINKEQDFQIENSDKGWKVKKAAK